MSESARGEELLVEKSGGVACFTINRPERRNALSWQVIRSLRREVSEARDDPDVRVVVLTGAGEKAFSAGADLGGMSAADAGHLAQHDARGELAGLFEDLWSLGKPTIARVQGLALAGGFGLALACDLVVASEQARFGAPEIGVGLWPFMITVPMVRSMPPKRALEMMLSGRTVDAAEAERIGFVTRVVPAADLDGAVNELAASIVSRSPAVVRLGRNAFYAVWDMSTSEALAYLHSMLTITTSTEDAVEGITAFLEKRPPEWRGR